MGLVPHPLISKFFYRSHSREMTLYLSHTYHTFAVISCLSQAVFSMRISLIKFISSMDQGYFQCYITCIMGMLMQNVLLQVCKPDNQLTGKHFTCNNVPAAFQDDSA